MERIAKAALLTDIVKLPKEERFQAANRVYDWWLSSFDKAFQEAKARENTLVAEEAAIKKRGTIAHVMEEKPDKPKAFVLDRGEYDKRLDEVSPGTPAALSDLSRDASKKSAGFSAVASPARSPTHKSCHRQSILARSLWDGSCSHKW